MPDATGRVLKLLTPAGEERLVPLSAPALTIGSSADQGLVLPGHGVSSRHCRLELRGDAILVYDSGSRNGTYINHRRCTEPTRLGDGDRLGVGAYTLELVARSTDLDQARARLQAPVARIDQGESERRAAERERLRRYARDWDGKGRPRRLLLDARELAAVAGWTADERSADPTLLALYSATVRARRIRLALGLCLAGAALGGVFVALASSGGAPVAVDLPATSPTVEQPVPKDSPEPPPDPSRPAAKWIEHTVQAEETYEDIAHYYGMSPATLAQFNAITLGQPPKPGARLRVLTTRPPRPPLQEEIYVVSPGDDWRTIADYYGVTAEALRRQNRKFGDQLRGGEELHFLVESEPFAAPTPNEADLPIFIVPEGASSEGKVTGGALRNAVQLVPSPLCDLRCSMHSYATNYTVTALLSAIAEFRRSGYDGQIMIGDLSRREGGQYGPHKSHQSGRDADIWLLVKRKRYSTGCHNCSTTSCRPEPEDVDWAAQWRFIKALDAGGKVQEIFLSHWLHPKLHAAAVAQGATPQELARMIQWPKKPGWPALVMHSEGHIHHIHVRFKCDPADTACSNSK